MPAVINTTVCPAATTNSGSMATSTLPIFSVDAKPGALNAIIEAYRAHRSNGNIPDW
jgi:hypothetical protein